MISILVAGAVGLAVTLLGTPVAIRAFTVWGWGQRIREDGPHTHFEKMGTPTMGGLVILLAPAPELPGRPDDVRRPAPSAGVALLLAAVGFGLVGLPRRLHEGAAPAIARAHEVAEVPGHGASCRVMFAVVVAHYSSHTGTLHEPLVHPRHRDQAGRASTCSGASWC